jgi:peroxiredoxin
MNKNSINFLSVFCIFVAVFSFSAVADVKVGSPAPDFTLTSVDGKKVNLSEYKGKVVVLEWFNPGCPFVQKHYKPHHMQDLQAQYTAKGVVWLSINSTNPSHQDYREPAKALQQAKDMGLNSTALLPDPDGSVGKNYGAKATPHMFIVDANGNVAYEGAIDDTPSPNSDPAKAKNYVQQALDEILAGKPVSTPSTKQYGCGIKYAN